ncbi:hypothetical protein [Streptomyces sp. SP18CS02]|uniref:hypothetical protein n=1 Tax=Streptomyces sp. SP18CS02 TaxID=3002531 RepID=UPI002E7AAD56|nr:hypothetical protein [Streptomyces sp. SP18CS02]MEE1753297.1 hypothetical protein [Streptomyces sp. SP18CS02]
MTVTAIADVRPPDAHAAPSRPAPPPSPASGRPPVQTSGDPPADIPNENDEADMKHIATVLRNLFCYCGGEIAPNGQGRPQCRSCGQLYG